jgi:hypothetical protein
VVSAWRVIAAHGGDVGGAEVGDGVAPGVGAATFAEPAEPVDHAEAVQDDQAVLGGVTVGKQGGGDLFGG